MKRKLNVLVACEESQAVCSAFRALGHNAYSCDLMKCSGGHPEWHFCNDIKNVLDGCDYVLQDGSTATVVGDWDIMICHPPCTFLAVSGARWFYHPEDKHLPVEQYVDHKQYD